ncbi:hypothetical protein ERO13_D08G158050v2 [Gossypium hirsutum]|uniref:Uncharacterized protein n=2 Tax=Gossypium TaxID=3633 RepID=A0A5J5QGK0_GOSBA|nr:hypothetical protein ES319_D08G170800v1 [Gossypium barbadense]KAG4134466.1 hypothetical protein ERO13_D08G158050v2 [Gossypium hirsutum]TYG57927.1 hypothetical protein ES288_D08G181200v1 [Gossypium darwinii]
MPMPQLQMVKVVPCLPSCNCWFLLVHIACKVQQKISQSCWQISFDFKQSRNTCSTVSIPFTHLGHSCIPINLL